LPPAGAGIAPGTTATVTAHVTTTKNLNTGTWSEGKWNGSSVITFPNASLPAGAVPIVVNQAFTVNQIDGNSKGTYTVWLYDSTGLNKNAIKVSSQLDLDPDRTDLFNPPPIVQLRVDDTYGIDSISGTALYPALLSNQRDQIAL
jgi:hypothetical protein